MGNGAATGKGWAIYGISVVFPTLNCGGLLSIVGQSNKIGRTSLHSFSSTNAEFFRRGAIRKQSTRVSVTAAWKTSTEALLVGLASKNSFTTRSLFNVRFSGLRSHASLKIRSR